MADDGSNTEILGLDLAVPQQNRRQRIGTALLAHGVAIAHHAGRHKLVGHVYDSVPSGRLFLESFGAVAGMDLHVNSCAVDRLEWGALGMWADDAPAGYTRQVIEGTWPEELFEKAVPLFEILERDAPTGDDYQARVWTAERIKGSHDLYLSTADSILAIAIEDASSDLAGISHLIRRHSDPETWQVTFTMVDPNHRGHGIGRWLKGAVNLRAREVWPDGKYTETMNAFANAPMLAINNAMGFSHEYTMTEMSANVSSVEAALDS